VAFGAVLFVEYLWSLHDPASLWDNFDSFGLRTNAIWALIILSLWYSRARVSVRVGATWSWWRGEIFSEVGAGRWSTAAAAFAWKFAKFACIFVSGYIFVTVASRLLTPIHLGLARDASGAAAYAFVITVTMMIGSDVTEPPTIRRRLPKRRWARP
jgi:hypothetical protein